MIKTYKRPIYSYGILYKASKNKYSLTQGGDDSIRLSFTYTQEDYPEGFTTYVDNDKPTKLIKKMKQYPYEPVVVKCIIDGGTKFELNGDTYWSSQIGFLSEVGLSYKNFSITFREKQFSKEDEKINKILQEQLRRDYLRSVSPEKPTRLDKIEKIISGESDKKDQDLYKNDNNLRKKVLKKKFDYLLYNFKPKK